MVSLNEVNKLFRQFPNNSFLQITLDNIKYIAERIHNNSSVQISEIREFEKTVKYHLIRMQDQRDAASDIEKMSALGYLPKYNLKEGLRLTVEWYVDQFVCTPEDPNSSGILR